MSISKGLKRLMGPRTIDPQRIRRANTQFDTLKNQLPDVTELAAEVAVLESKITAIEAKLAVLEAAKEINGAS